MREQGVAAAIELFGLEKTAFVRRMARGAARMAVGQPRKYFDQFRQGGLFRRGGLIRNAMTPKGPFDAALMYGLPAAELYSAAGQPAENRGSAIGSALGTGVGVAAGMPLGILGVSAGASLGQTLGSSVGSVFNSKPETMQRRQLSGSH